MAGTGIGNGRGGMERATYLICGRVDERMRTTMLMTTPAMIGHSRRVALAFFLVHRRSSGGLNNQSDLDTPMPMHVALTRHDALVDAEDECYNECGEHDAKLDLGHAPRLDVRAEVQHVADRHLRRQHGHVIHKASRSNRPMGRVDCQSDEEGYGSTIK